MTMVAVGGSIGTGLLLGSAAALEISGPGVILSYLVAAFIAWTVTMAVGELASMHPAAGSFGVYGELYLNQYLGFLCRAGYWAAIAFSIGAEMVASATYMAYWFPAVRGEIWVVVFAALLLLVNLRESALRGTLRVLVLHDQDRHDRGVHPGRRSAVARRAGASAIHGARRIPAQRSDRAPAGSLSAPSMPSGASRCWPSPLANRVRRRDIPRASHLTFSLLAGLYLGAIIVLVGVMPWNHAESPRVHSSPCSAWQRFLRLPTS